MGHVSLPISFKFYMVKQAYIFAFGRTFYHLAKSPTYWLTILLIIIVALLPRFLFKVVHQCFWPSDILIAREAEVLGKPAVDLGPLPDQESS